MGGGNYPPFLEIWACVPISFPFIQEAVLGRTWGKGLQMMLGSLAIEKEATQWCTSCPPMDSHRREAGVDGALVGMWGTQCRDPLPSGG